MGTAALAPVSGPESERLLPFGSGLRDRLRMPPANALLVPRAAADLVLISPELALVDAELARVARERLPEPGALARGRPHD